MSENKEEDKYFKQRQLERREQARRERELTALRETEREGIAEVLNTSEEIAEEALELGFSQETSRVLPLIPLIQVAWVDGSVSSAEERAILDLAELGLPAQARVLSLVAFNVGIELAQLAFVAALLVPLERAARWTGYERWIVQGGSGVIATLAGFWLLERSLF